jgi:hypothetical protein
MSRHLPRELNEWWDANLQPGISENVRRVHWRSLETTDLADMHDGRHHRPEWLHEIAVEFEGDPPKFVSWLEVPDELAQRIRTSDQPDSFNTNQRSTP